jgi:PhnB protein
MANVQTMSRTEAQIRAVIDGWVKALRAKDVDAVMAHYAPDIVAFDLAPPLQFRGAASCRKLLEEWFPTFRGPVDCEIRELDIEAREDIAYCRSLNHVTGQRTDGSATDIWVRATTCLRRTDGNWLIAHEHVSVPFYMDGSFKAAVDLKP